MSADNGIRVAYNTGKYEVRYYQGDSEGTARHIVDNPLVAIVTAHKLQQSERTEYGVSVSKATLSHAERTIGYILGAAKLLEGM